MIIILTTTTTTTTTVYEPLLSRIKEEYEKILNQTINRLDIYKDSGKLQQQQ